LPQWVQVKSFIGTIFPGAAAHACEKARTGAVVFQGPTVR